MDFIYDVTKAFDYVAHDILLDHYGLMCDTQTNSIVGFNSPKLIELALEYEWKWNRFQSYFVWSPAR